MRVPTSRSGLQKNPQEQPKHTKIKDKAGKHGFQEE